MDDAIGFILSNEDVARRMKHVTMEARRGGKFLSSRQQQIFVVARGCMYSWTFESSAKPLQWLLINTSASCWIKPMPLFWIQSRKVTAVLFEIFVLGQTAALAKKITRKINSTPVLHAQALRINAEQDCQTPGPSTSLHPTFRGARFQRS
jgi:hypothetical protein